MPVQVLLRKGGIDESRFEVKARRFALFPSYFHAEADLLKPGLAERYANVGSLSHTHSLSLTHTHTHANTHSLAHSLTRTHSLYVSFSLSLQAMALDPKTAAELTLSTVAEISAAWTTPDPGIVAAIDDLHVGTEKFLDNRIKWRRGQPLTVLEVRAYHLKQPIVVVPRPELFGCFSWVPLPEGSLPDGLAGLQPCVPEEEFQRRQMLLRERLSKLEDVVEC
jgi:hypothetical protein